MINVVVLEKKVKDNGLTVTPPEVASFDNTWDASEFLKNNWNPVELQELVNRKKILIIEGNFMQITPKTEDHCIIHF